MSSTPSAPLQFRPLGRTATSPGVARISELSSDGVYTSVEASKKLDNVRIYRSAGVGQCEISTALNLTRAEARALALELLAAADATDPLELGIALEDIGYALNRHVPDMERGFSIETSYGQLRIPEGELATRIQATLGNALFTRWAASAVAKAA